ncbi:Uncharacterised protein [BD1-7 clade bacterium]|uniref:DUF4381 domain-containing protein n=1 Tax=BD1-7 clade bacterium TaxID=2029982 RepID=A0A5S9NMS4_9GAMM|nr:Uncharacterised protein [BD1-7 clade bacterium]CAA0094570.1 Uncharacterised protein [BD1-7 clade bacterium]
MQQPAASNPLDQLRDIHLPDAITWWPPAPGWWAVTLLAIIALFTTVYTLVKIHQKRRYRRLAIAELDQLSSEKNDAAELAEALTQLIRRTLKAADEGYDKQQSALTGDNLHEILKPELTDTQIHWITQGKYQANAEVPDTAALTAAVRQWIKGHKV